MARKWSKDEDNILIENYGKIKFSEINEKLTDRTIASIQCRIKRLDLKLPKEEINIYSDIEELKKYIPESVSFRDLSKKMSQPYSKEFNDYVRKSGIDISHFTESHSGNTKYKSQIGKKFGKLTIIDIKYENKNIRSYYYATCRCDCGETKEILFPNVIRGYTRSCGCIREYKKANNHNNWSGIGEMSGTFFKNLKRNAKRRGYEFSISKTYLWELYEKQNRKCVLSGIEIYFGSCDVKQTTTTSLDRIDNNKGYVEGNVQWVHKDINRMRGTMTVKDFIIACNLVTETCK